MLLFLTPINWVHKQSIATSNAEFLKYSTFLVLTQTIPKRSFEKETKETCFWNIQKWYLLPVMVFENCHHALAK